MRLNTLKPGSRKAPKRLGRGSSGGQGKTCGRGHKGQRARAGGYHKVGFEGGQMPLQRRLPKIGFNSAKAAATAEVRLHELAIPGDDIIDIDSLKRAGIVHQQATRAKVIVSGTLARAVKVRGLALTAGARKAIEAAGGSIQD
ncbi:MAG: 50S ribosomal protein L15 [Gammaproteobacteria bacterium]|nr:50S ribosomal protein L15 [Gammaproteobacteria bacterium]